MKQSLSLLFITLFLMTISGCTARTSNTPGFISTAHDLQTGSYKQRLEDKQVLRDKLKAMEKKNQQKIVQLYRKGQQESATLQAKNQRKQQRISQLEKNYDQTIDQNRQLKNRISTLERQLQSYNQQQRSLQNKIAQLELLEGKETYNKRRYQREVKALLAERNELRKQLKILIHNSQ